MASNLSQWEARLFAELAEYINMSYYANLRGSDPYESLNGQNDMTREQWKKYISPASTETSRRFIVSPSLLLSTSTVRGLYFKNVLLNSDGNDPRSPVDILAFRGTAVTTSDPLSDIMADIHACGLEYASDLYDIAYSVLVPGQKGHVHAGFAQVYDSIKESVHAIVKAHWHGSGRPLYITGHSLGAAVAQICAVDLKLLRPNNYDNIALYTIASPATGTQEFSKFLDESLRDCMFLEKENNRDPVAAMRLQGVILDASVNPAMAFDFQSFRPLILGAPIASMEKPSSRVRFCPGVGHFDHGLKSYARSCRSCAFNPPSDVFKTGGKRWVISQRTAWGTHSPISVASDNLGEVHCIVHVGGNERKERWRIYGCFQNPDHDVYNLCSVLVDGKIDRLPVVAYHSGWFWLFHIRGQKLTYCGLEPADDDDAKIKPTAVREIDIGTDSLSKIDENTQFTAATFEDTLFIWWNSGPSRPNRVGQLSLKLEASPGFDNRYFKHGTPMAVQYTLRDYAPRQDAIMSDRFFQPVTSPQYPFGTSMEMEVQISNNQPVQAAVSPDQSLLVLCWSFGKQQTLSLLSRYQRWNVKLATERNTFVASQKVSPENDINQDFNGRILFFGNKLLMVYHHDNALQLGYCNAGLMPGGKDVEVEMDVTWLGPILDSASARALPIHDNGVVGTLAVMMGKLYWWHIAPDGAITRWEYQ